MSLKIEHAHLVLPYQVLQDAWLISREGKITAYGVRRFAAANVFYCGRRKRTVSHAGLCRPARPRGRGGRFPGWGRGCLCSAMRPTWPEAPPQGWPRCPAQRWRARWRAFVYTRPCGKGRRSFRRCRGWPGVHLEGPYFSQKERGAQDETIIRLPDAAEYERILEQAPCLAPLVHRPANFPVR